MMDKDQLLKEARQAIADGDYEKALEICNSLLQEFPDDIEIHMLYEDATNAAKLSQQVSSNDGYGTGYRELEFSASDVDQDEFSQKFPDISEAFKARDFSAVISLCQEYLKQYPDNEELKQKLQKAIELQEAEPFLQSFISTGQTLLESGLYIDAIKQFEKVKIIDPTYPDIEELITQAKAAIHGDVFSPSAPSEGAAPAEQQEAVLTPTEEKVRQLIQEGQSYFNSGQYQKAIDIWSEVFMYDITNKEAQQLIEKARNEMTIVKGQVQKYLQEAKKYIEEENYENAEKILTTASELDKENQEINQLLSLVSSKRRPTIDVDMLPRADAAFHAKDYKLALELYKKIYEAQPENKELESKIAECQALFQKQEQIKKLLSDANVFHMQGKKDSAIFALNKILEIDPGNKEAEMFLNTIQSPFSEAISAAPKAAKKSPLLKIIIAVLFLGILGGVYFYFFKEKEIKEPEKPIATPRRPAAANKPKVISTPTPTPVIKEPKILTPDEEKKILQLLDEAHNFQLNGDLEKALQKYQEVLSINPDQPDAKAKADDIMRKLEAIQAERKNFLSEAEKYYSMQDFEAAVRVLKVALDKFPNDPIFLALIKDTYFNLGIVSLKKLQCDLATQYLKQLEFFDPSDKSAQKELKIALSCKEKTSIEPSLQYEINNLETRPFNIPESTSSENKK